MAQLPGIQEQVVTSKPGTSPITASAIEGPFAMLAKTLNDTSGGLESLGIKEGEEQGRKAVTQDADGNLQVEQMGPLWGRAGEAFNRSAKMTYLTRLGQQVQSDVLAKRIEFDGQPDKFQAWGQGYIEQLTGTASDEMRPSVSKMVTNHIAENYQSIALQRQRLDTQSALTNFKSQIVTLDNRMAALARDGGTDTPEYQQALTDSRALYNELGKNPQFNYPQARIDGEVSEMESRHQAEAVVGDTVRTRDKLGTAAAKQLLQSKIWDPKLNLTESQRTHYVALGMSTLENKNAENAAQIKALEPEIKAHVDRLRTGAFVDPRQTNDLLQRATSLGDTKDVYELNAWAAYRPWIQNFRQSDDATRYDMLRTLATNPGTVGAFRDWIDRKYARGSATAAGQVPEQAANVRTMVAAEAQRQGVDPKLAQTVAYLESGFDPAKKPIGPDGKPLSDAFGLFNFIPTTAARYGVTPDSPVEDQIRGGIAELKEIQATLKTQLGRDPTPAEIYTAHYQGLGGAKAILGADAGADLKSTLDAARPGWVSKSGKTWGEVVLAANPWLQKIGTDQQNPRLGAVKEKILDSSVKEMKTRLGQTVDGLIAGIKKNSNISAEDLQSAINWVQITGDFDSGRKLAEALSDKENSDLLRRMPEDKRAALISALTVQNASSSTHASRAALEMFRQTNEQATAGMKNDPLTEIGVRGWAPAPKAIDWNSPQGAGAEFAAREQSIRTARARDTTLGPMPVITVAEQGALKTVLTQGDPKQGAGILAAIQANTSPENWRATMMSGPVKDALDAASRSYEPTRLNTAMSTLDQLYRADPQGFKQVYKDDTISRLQTWQAYKDSLSPQQMAEKFQRADDPATHDAREKLVKAAGDKLGSITAADVTYQMGTAWPLTPGFVARNITGSQAGAPIDELQGQILVEEYKRDVAQRYADIGDINKAKAQAAQNLSLRWGASPDVANNTLMKWPPERYYPAIDGSHKWMRDQIISDVVKYIADKRGVKSSDEPLFQEGFDVSNFDGNVGSILPNGYSYKIFPDVQTEAEIKTGKPPRYKVFVMDERGVGDFVRDDRNNVARYRWGAGPAQSKAEADFNTKRGVTLDMQNTPVQF